MINATFLNGKARKIWNFFEFFATRRNKNAFFDAKPPVSTAKMQEFFQQLQNKSDSGEEDGQEKKKKDCAKNREKHLDSVD